MNFTFHHINLFDMKNDDNYRIMQAYQGTAIAPFINRLSYPIMDVVQYNSGGNFEHHFIGLNRGIIVVNHDVCTVQVFATTMPINDFIELWANDPDKIAAIRQIPEDYRNETFDWDEYPEEGIGFACGYAERWYDYLTTARPQVFKAEPIQTPVFLRVEFKGNEHIVNRRSHTGWYYITDEDGSAYPSAYRFFVKDTSGRGVTNHCTIEHILAVDDHFDEDGNSLQDWAVSASSGDEFNAESIRSHYTCID